MRLIIFEKRKEIKNAINVLKKFSSIPKHSPEFRGLSGFSHAEKEQFALALLQFSENFDLPDKARYFVNDERKATFEKLRKETIDSSNQASLEVIRRKLIEKGYDVWADASYNELICCCINKANHKLEVKN